MGWAARAKKAMSNNNDKPNGKVIVLPTVGDVTASKMQRPIAIVTFTSTVVAMCTCGSSVPVVIVVLPGGWRRGDCNACGLIWTCDKIDYLEGQGDDLPHVRIGLRCFEPMIVTPKPQIF